MQVRLLKESGYEESLLGLSLSRNQPVGNMVALAKKLAHMDGGHNKFLEFIQLWIDVTAPRFWWQEFATYRVGTSTQSESTVYSITKRELTMDNFEYPLEIDILNTINSAIRWYKRLPSGEETEYKKDYFLYIKNILPEGFLQRRIISTNYKVFRNIYNQRKNHRLPQWKLFLDRVVTSIEHPEFIVADTRAARTEGEK